jgi:hypothetical protein
MPRKSVVKKVAPRGRLDLPSVTKKVVPEKSVVKKVSLRGRLDLPSVTKKVVPESSVVKKVMLRRSVVKKARPRIQKRFKPAARPKPAPWRASGSWTASTWETTGR